MRVPKSYQERKKVQGARDTSRGSMGHAKAHNGGGVKQREIDRTVSRDAGSVPGFSSVTNVQAAEVRAACDAFLRGRGFKVYDLRETIHLSASETLAAKRMRRV